MINYEELVWESDCSGIKLGFPEIEIVGVYSNQNNPNKLIYIDIENDKILSERRVLLESKYNL